MNKDKKTGRFTVDIPTIARNPEKELEIAFSLLQSLEQPSSSDYKIIFAYHKGKVVFKGSINEWTEFKNRPENKDKNLVFDTETNKDEYKKAANEYNKKSQQIISVIRDLVFEIHGCAKLSKDMKALCWNMAYEEGRSYGYHEVIGALPKYIDFAIKIIQEHENSKKIENRKKEILKESDPFKYPGDFLNQEYDSFEPNR